MFDGYIGSYLGV